MFTQQQVNAVIAYNNTAKIFRITDNGRIIWDVRNMHVIALRELNVHIKYAEDFAQLKKAVKKQLSKVD